MRANTSGRCCGATPAQEPIACSPRLPVSTAIWVSPNGRYHRDKRALAGRALEVAEHLLPRGVLVGREWCVGNADGDLGQSLKICVRGGKVAVWYRAQGCGDRASRPRRRQSSMKRSATRARRNEQVQRPLRRAPVHAEGFEPAGGWFTSRFSMTAGTRYGARRRSAHLAPGRYGRPVGLE